MKILQYNELDLPGRRFNGYDLNLALREQGHKVTQYVFTKYSRDKDVKSLCFGDGREKIIALEQKYELYNQLQPYGRLLMRTPEFQQADIVHYHLVHNNILAMPDFPLLTQAKPAVWTWHDPWAVTGHCVHPKECEGWRTGCSPCPHLDEHFALRTDCAGQLWQQKMEIYRQMDADIVVSSDFMLDFAKNSPLGQCFKRVHKIPFGVKVEDFGTATREEARNRLGIPRDNFVIAYRCETNPYKGSTYVHKFLSRIQKRSGITVLAIGTARVPRMTRAKFHCVELGWQDDTKVLADFYSACDVFLMPSIAESFGLMAVEAMASARPVVCFEGTALPAVTFAPDCGIAVPKGDVDALFNAVMHLRDCPEEAKNRGEACRRKAEEHYRFEDYVNKHLELYKEAANRTKRENSIKEI